MDVSKMLNVIDVSRHQGRINWAYVAKVVDAAMIKVGGSDDGFYMDGQAQYNVMEARQQGLPVGFYYFLGGFHSPLEEAQHIVQVLNLIGGLRAGEPFCLDWEQRRTGLDEVGYMVAIVDHLTRFGLPAPVVYMNSYYARTADWSGLVTRNCPLWIANWGDNDATAEPWEYPSSRQWPDFWLWQYSSTGNVPGIRGRVDLNKLRGSIESFKNAGLRHDFKIPGEPAHVSVPTPSVQYVDYTVVLGDTLSRIAGRFNKRWQELYAINRDRVSNPNRIFTGQKIRIWSAGQQSQHPAPIANKQPEARYHVVERGESLSSIAAMRNVSGGWRALYNLNISIIGANPNYILPGQKLKLP